MARKKDVGKNDVIMSATKMSMYLQCKWKYWCNYVLKLPRKPNVSFKLGLAVHEALAEAGEIWKMSEGFTEGQIKRVKAKYNEVAAKEGIADANVYNEGLQMVLGRLNYFANGEILTVEDRFRVTTDTGLVLIGAMDKVEKIGDDTILVVDYKTSKYFETTDELKADIQLSLYDAVASIKYPEYNRIILSLDYLRDDPVYTYRTSEEREIFMDYMNAVHKEMLKLKKEEALPSLNEMCNWCDFTDNCTTYQEALSSKTFIKKKPEEYDDVELVKDYVEIKNRKRILDNREKQLKFYILEKIKASEQNLVGEDKMIYIRQNALTNYDPRTVYENVPIEEFLKMVKMSKRDVDAYLLKHPACKSKILETAKKNHTSPFLSYKKIK